MNRRNHLTVRVLARLKPGITLAQAQAEVDAFAARLAKDHSESNTDRGMHLTPLHEFLAGHVRPALLILFGAVGFVLLIACANVANLLLARGTERSREIAVRYVLGASRVRLLRQFLTESLLLSGLGGVVGLLVAGWILNLLIRMLPQNFPRIVEIHIDPWVLGFTAAIALLAGLVSGTAPAFQTASTDLSHSLKGGSGLFGSSPRHWFRNLLVVAEIALASVLLVGAGLLFKSYWVVTHVDLGFNPENVLTTSPPAPDASQRDAFYDELFQRVLRLPGVKSVAVVDQLPLLGSGSASYDFTVKGHPPLRAGNDQTAHVRGISPDYFRVLQIPVVKGRPFSELDTGQSEWVVIINQALARRYFGDDDPVDQMLNMNGQRKVVGVVGDVKPNGFESLAVPEIYLPNEQWSGRGNLLVRTTGHSSAVAANLRAEILAMNPIRPVDAIRPLEQILSGQEAPRRFNAILLGSFAALGLLIAMVGVYGVISYSVSQRTREIGVRIALGAQQCDVLSLVVGQGMRLALLGVGIGLVAALALSRMLQTLLFEIKPTDPFTFAIIPLALAGVALFACWVPARRAARVDPMVALRYE